MRIRFVLRPPVVLLGLALLASACRSSSPQVELKVAAASSLAEVFDTLAHQFGEEYAVRVTPTFASTGQLAQQIRNGAPYDIFAAADPYPIDALINEGFLDAKSRAVYARGKLVVISPLGSTLNLRSLSDIASAAVERIAIANPNHAPYGIAAREALTSSGIWAEVESKIIYAETVKQAAVIVATGNADAGIIARSVVDQEVEVEFEIPPAQHSPILHLAASSSNTVNEEVALAFLAFLQSPAGQTILLSSGFSLP